MELRKGQREEIQSAIHLIGRAALPFIPVCTHARSYSSARPMRGKWKLLAHAYTPLLVYKAMESRKSQMHRGALQLRRLSKGIYKYIQAFHILVTLAFLLWRMYVEVACVDLWQAMLFKKKKRIEPKRVALTLLTYWNWSAVFTIYWPHSHFTFFYF